MKNLILLLALFFFVAVSCEKKDNQGETSLKKPERIKREIDLITDSLKGSWNNMNTSDEQKLKDVKRLLDEISYTGNHNQLQYEKLVDLHKHVLALKYDDKSMEDSKRIDQYDAATDSLLKETFKLVNSTQEIENHPIAKTLAEDIMKADNDLVIYRARYDRWVKEYNEYIEKHENKIKKLGIPYSSYKKKPMFTLSK